MLELLIYIIAWIIALIIMFSPVIIIGLIIYLYWKNKNKQRKNNKNEFKSEWTWDENRQLWVHDSEYASQIHVEHKDQTYEQWRAEYLKKARSQEKGANNGNYHYRGNDISQNIIEKPKHTHYENTIQPTKQQAEPKITIDIPENIQELIREARKEKETTQQKVNQQKTVEQTENHGKEVPTNLSQEQIDSINHYRTSFQKPRTSQPVRTPEVKPQNTWAPVYQTPPVPEPAKTEKKSEFQDVYKAVSILTKNEMNNYRTLMDAAMRKGYVVWPKVRLADIVTPRSAEKFMSNFGKIKSKHVDFVIADGNAKIKAVIELDDSSHDREDRKKRDEFVDTILEDCGYKIIHTRYIWPDILDNI